MAQGESSINPEVVAEIASMVSTTLDNINTKFTDFQAQVLDVIEDSWYNENAVKVMPGHVSALTKLSTGINDSLESLVETLATVADNWSKANGATATYSVKKANNAPHQATCDVSDNRDGFRGMDTGNITTALKSANTIKGEMDTTLNDLIKASDKEGFRGGSQQEDLVSLCNTLKGLIDKAIVDVVTDVSTNANIAKENIEEVTTSTETAFTINE